MKIEFTAYPRTQQGTGASRRLRRAGRAPGIVYGAGKDARAIELDHNALHRHLKMEAFHASILEMTLEGEKQRVLLRDFQMHPWKPEVQHVDFQRVDPSKKIYMSVPLHLINADTCTGVKLGGGVVNHILTEVEIQCLPDHLPEHIGVDLGSLELGQSIRLNDLQLPEGVEIAARLHAENQTVVSVQVPRAVAADEEAAAAEAAAATEAAAGEAAPAAAAAEATEQKGAEKKEK
jgi:large subunit ribosomal protein L25